MKIAHVIPYSVTFPLTSHNGRYEWVRQLAFLQIQQGHEVIIYGNPASHSEGLTFAGIPSSFGDKEQNNIETFRNAFAQNSDIFHSHFDDLHYRVANETTRPIVYTQHWWPNDQLVNTVQQSTYPNVWAVPPTQYMHEFDVRSGIQTKGHIYHGIDLSVFQPTGVRKNDRLLFVGRISPEKNLHVALALAKKAGAKLDIVGKVAPKNEMYWQNLQPFIDGETIRYLGPMNTTELVTTYSGALGVLSPFEITEPFGLVAIEAQACGTPIIMTRGGSRAELLKDGKTGFLCEAEDEYVAAINKLLDIKSTDCLQFAKQFDIHTMAKNYVNLYEELLTN
ncbi:MAG: glycosyltransferase [Candidatus Saccharimonadaceae bacterium]